MDKSNLTPKQEAFCMAYRETGNASEAYRRSYNAENVKPESVHRMAKALLDNVKIASRLKELAEVTAGRHQITVDDLIKELEEARKAALEAETVQSSAAVSATMGKAKLLGFDKQVLELTGKDGGAIKTESNVTLSPEEAYKRMVNGGS